MKTKSIFGTVALIAWLACCGSLSADPLNNWSWRNPLPNGNPFLGTNGLFSMIFTNGHFFAVGDRGYEGISSDGKYWTESPTATTNPLNSLVYGGGQFVAVGNNGAIETSPDGTNWTLQSSGITNSLAGIACGNGAYCAVCPTRAIIYSADGVTWSRAPTLLSFNAIAGSSYGFVAINSGTNVAYFSSNGRTWSTNSLPNPIPGWEGTVFQPEIVTYADGLFLIGGYIFQSGTTLFFYILASPDGINWSANGGAFARYPSDYSFFMAGSGSNTIAGGSAGLGNQFLQYSPDGINWSSLSNSVIPWNQLPATTGAYGNGAYAMASSQSAWFSPDSFNWTGEAYTNPPTGPVSTFNSIAYNGSTYVVATSSSFVDSTGSAFSVESGTPSLNSVVVFGSTFVGVGTNGAVYQSANGVSWTKQTSNTANNLHGVAAGNSLLVAVGDSGAIQTSPNGTSWTSRTSGTSLALNGVVYSNGLYVAVGQQGTILTSPDATTWTARSSGVMSNLLAVTYGPAGFLAAGVDGTILTSLNGVNWTQQNSDSSATLESASAGNGYYLVTGTYATVLTSFDGINWTPRNVGATGGQTFYGSGFLNGRFDVVGAYGNILESDVVPQIFDLQVKSVPPNDVVTAFVTPGSTVRILSSSNLVNSSAWTTAATFNNAAAITLWTNNTPVRYNFYRLVSP
jgi:hypothetical protein